MACRTVDLIDEIGGFPITHLNNSIPREEYLELIKNHFVIHSRENNTLIFRLQDGPIKESGVNGCQVDTMIELAAHIIRSLNNEYPFRENAIAVTKLEESLLWLYARKKNREKRGVEGRNIA